MEPAAITPMVNRKKCSAVSRVEYPIIRVVLVTHQKKLKDATTIDGDAATATFVESAINWWPGRRVSIQERVLTALQFGAKKFARNPDTGTICEDCDKAIHFACHDSNRRPKFLKCRACKMANKKGKNGRSSQAKRTSDNEERARHSSDSGSTGDRDRNGLNDSLRYTGLARWPYPQSFLFLASTIRRLRKGVERARLRVSTRKLPRKL